MDVFNFIHHKKAEVHTLYAPEESLKSTRQKYDYVEPLYNKSKMLTSNVLSAETYPFMREGIFWSKGSNIANISVLEDSHLEALKKYKYKYPVKITWNKGIFYVDSTEKWLQIIEQEQFYRKMVRMLKIEKEGYVLPEVHAYNMINPNTTHQLIHPNAKI